MESMHTSESALIPIGDAAARLGVSVETMRRWADNGQIPVITLPSGHRRFRLADLDAFKPKADA